MSDLSTLAALVGVATVAGFVDSIAGGGGLLCLPALLLSGLDPVAALATNKLHGTFGTASATLAFWRRGLLQPQNHWRDVALAFAGAGLGVACVSLAPKSLLTHAMPPLLIAVALYFAFAPKFAEAGSTPRLPQPAFTFFFAPLIAFYDGIFGPGTGSFFMLALTALFGLGIVEATGRTKLLNFTSNIAALIVFAFGGKMIWATGLVMGLGQIAGAQLGAHIAIKSGSAVIRPLLVIVCLAMAVKLIWF